jgi:hypothetical protein
MRSRICSGNPRGRRGRKTGLNDCGLCVRRRRVPSRSRRQRSHHRSGRHCCQRIPPTSRERGGAYRTGVAPPTTDHNTVALQRWFGAAEVDPELDSRQEPFFDPDSQQTFRTQLAERLGAITLADDLVGLYVVVKEGLLSIPEHGGRVPGFVIWGWTFGFESDAGRRAIRSIGALHSLLFGA